MLQYKKGRFHCEGVSFEIPENFYYNTMCDMMFDNGMEFISPDSKITIEFSVRKIKRSTKEDFKHEGAEAVYAGGSLHGLRKATV